MEKKTPLRTCIGCRKKAPKLSMIRLACTTEGIGVDIKQRLKGRGVYLCRDRACVERGLKAKPLTHFLRVPASRQKIVALEVLEGLKKEVEKLIGEEMEIPKKEI